MHKRFKNQLNSPASITVIILILIIFGVAYVATKAHKNSGSNLIPETTSQPKSTASPTPSTSSSLGTYKLSFDVLGVSAMFPNTFTGLNYVVAKPKSTETRVQSVIKLSTDALTGQDANCSNASGTPGLGELYKGSGQYPSKPDPTTLNGDLIKQFRSFYIAYVSPQTACSDSKATSDLAASLQTTFSSSLKSSLVQN